MATPIKTAGIMPSRGRRRNPRAREIQKMPWRVNWGLLLTGSGRWDKDLAAWKQARKMKKRIPTTAPGTSQPIQPSWGRGTFPPPAENFPAMAIAPNERRARLRLGVAHLRSGPVNLIHREMTA